MSKHRAFASPPRHAAAPSTRRGHTTHRAPVTPTGTRTVRLGVLASLLLALAFPVVGAAGLAPPWSHSSPHATATQGPPLEPRRSGESPRPADRGSRPSPPASLLSEAESLAATASSPPPGSALSSPLLGAVVAGAARLLQITPAATAAVDGAAQSDATKTNGISPITTSGGTATVPPTATPAPTAIAKPKASAQPKASASAVAPSTASAPAVVPYVPAPAGYPFGASSVWRQQVGSAPAAANSATLVGTLSHAVTSLYNGVAAFNVDSYNTTFYSVAASTPRTDVGFTDCQGKGSEPSGLVAEFAQVPIPSTAVPANGTDAELTIYSASSDQLWEFWQASHDSGGWHACWGGRIDHVSSSPGYFSGGFGATATGLPVAGGMVSIADVKAGVINHAMSLEIVNPAPWNDFSYPAQRSDGGNNSPSAIPEGTRFRLDPSINVNSLNLTPLAKMIAKAAQTYGFIVTDQSGAVAVQAQSAAGASSNPWPALMAGVPSYQILAKFPWSQLQALPKNWGA